MAASPIDILSNKFFRGIYLISFASVKSGREGKKNNVLFLQKMTDVVHLTNTISS